jgi:hypothetical protein
MEMVDLVVEVESGYDSMLLPRAANRLDQAPKRYQIIRAQCPQ